MEYVSILAFFVLSAWFALSAQFFFLIAGGYANTLFALGKIQELSQELTPGNDASQLSITV